MYFLVFVWKFFSHRYFEKLKSYCMKKTLLKIAAVFLAVVMFQLQTNAASAFAMSAEDEAYVNFDESEIYSSFDQIGELVSYVSVNVDATFSDVESVNSNLVENVSSSAALALTANSAKEPPFISAFLWGCIFWGFGILVVALTTDMDMTYIMKSVWGCAASSVVYVLFYVIYYGLVVGTLWY
jgi:hypothetical protein